MSQTVKGTALQFTNDNKHCYAYTGGISVAAATEQTLIEFTTASEYILSKMQFGVHDKNKDDNSTFIVYLNDVVIWYDEKEDTESAGFDSPLLVIIPPFSKIKITAQITGSGGIDHAAIITGKVGLRQRVGNE